MTPGTYYQNGIHVDKNLTFQGQGDARDVIIDGQNKNSIILVNSVSNVIFKNITFINGKSPDYGGAIHSEKGGKIYVDSCIFENNTAKENGGAISVAGEQFWNYGKKITNKGYLKTNNCLFLNNYAGHDGGAVATYWGDTYLYNSTFRFNYAYRDGGATRTGIYSTTYVEGCIFENNTAKEWGGALYNWPGELTVKNSTIANNTAGTKGAAIITSGPLVVTKSTIVNNYGTYGVIYVDEETPAIPSRIVLTDNIISDNYPLNDAIIQIEHTTAKNSNINNNYWGSNTPDFNTIIKDDSGLLPTPTTWITEDNPSPVNPDSGNTTNPDNPDTPSNPDNPINPSNPDNPINPSNPDNPINPSTPETTNNTINHVNNQEISANIQNNQESNFLDEVISKVTTEISEITSNANKIVSNSTESNNIGTDSAQEATKSQESGSDKSAHELLDKEVIKEIESPLPYVITLIIIIGILIYGYRRYNKK